MKKNIKMLVLATAWIAACASPVVASTGTFTGPLTSASLSVDINGGQNSAGGSTTEGTGSPDPYGVTWSAWGGPTTTGGDGTQLPNSSANVTASSITKTFGSITATISLDPTNTIHYPSGFTLNSRDRGTPSGAAGDADMFRDFIFVGAGGKQGQNYLTLQLSGLTSGGSYKVAVYSFDSQGGHSMNWTATAPTSNGANSDGWWDGTQDGNFTAPADEQTITWSAGTTTPAPAVFTATADSTGTIKLYGYGGNGVTANNNSDTSYLNGFQIVGGGGGTTNTLTFLPVANTNINAGTYLTITNVVLTNGVPAN